MRRGTNSDFARLDHDRTMVCGVAFYSLSFMDYAGRLVQVASAYAKDDNAARLLSLHFDFFDVVELKILEGARLVFHGPIGQVTAS